MDQTTAPALEYLHDCVLLEVKYDVTQPGVRKVIVSLQTPSDRGYPPWEGRDLYLAGSGAYLFRYVARGYMDGLETLDRWDLGVCEPTRQELARDEALGLRVPSLRFSVVFHSGSFCELVCEVLTVDVGQPKRREVALREAT